MTTNNDPARSALAAFVSACGGNPPDWLREEHAAAEDALAAKPEPLAEFRCSGLDNESGLRFSDTLWARGIEEAETAAEMRWPDVEGWTIEAVEPEPPADTTHAVALRQIRGLATWHSAKAKGEIYRVATEALGGEGGAPPSVADVLARAESFIAGFEDDEEQEGVTELLRDLRAAQGKEG